MKTRYIHVRTIDPYTLQKSQNGGITFYGELDEERQVWNVGVSACHTSDRFVRKEGNRIAKTRFDNGEIVEVPVSENQGLWPALMDYDGPISTLPGVNNMFRAARNRYLRDWWLLFGQFL